MIWTPNLIIAGIAKCGTTTLHDLLAVHPRVTGGIEKEVRFLMDADDELCPAVNVRSAGLEGWASQYADQGSGDFDIWMDASPQYQYQQTALETLASLDPQPKVLFITRDPARRLFSLYQYSRYHQKDMPHVRSFAQYIDEVREPVDPRLAVQKMMRTAWRDTQYDLMLEEWGRIVPRERLFITSIEELTTSRDDVLRRIAAWLGIEPGPLLDAEVERSNPTVVTRSKLVRRLGGRVAKVLPETPMIRRLKTAIRDLNSGAVDRDELQDNAALLAELSAEFEPHMVRFNELRTELAW